MLIYDIEIINLPFFDEKKPKYSYANGWEDYVGMGISCIGFFDYADSKANIGCYDFHEWKEQLASMFASADMIIGFNNHKFDNPMMKAHGIDIDPMKSYDILENIYAAAGLSGKWDFSTHGGYSLDAVAKANGIIGKSGSGKDAPYMWQDGKHEEVIEYCMNDIRVTKAVLDRIFETGGLINLKSKKFMRIALPYVA